MITATMGRPGECMTFPRVYTITGPAGMFGAGAGRKEFTSVSAFDAYVQHVRRAGFVVTFSTPFSAAISRPLC